MNGLTEAGKMGWSHGYLPTVPEFAQAPYQPLSQVHPLVMRLIIIITIVDACSHSSVTMTTYV